MATFLLTWPPFAKIKVQRPPFQTWPPSAKIKVQRPPFQTWPPFAKIILRPPFQAWQPSAKIIQWPPFKLVAPRHRNRMLQFKLWRSIIQMLKQRLRLKVCPVQKKSCESPISEAVALFGRSQGCLMLAVLLSGLQRNQSNVVLASAHFERDLASISHGCCFIKNTV